MMMSCKMSAHLDVVYGGDGIDEGRSKGKASPLAPE